MKNIRTLTWTGLIFIAVFSGIYYSIDVSAQPDLQTFNQASEDFISAEQNVEVKTDGSVGDVAVAGANVKISGKVEGYVMAAGANINIDAPVGNDIWAAGANITVAQPVADNAMLAGSTVLLTEGATVGRDARIAAGSVEIKSRVNRNLKIAAGNVNVSSEVGGNLEVTAENLSLAPGAVVRGDLIVTGPNEPVISPQARVLGRIDYHRTESGGNSAPGRFNNWFGGWLLSFLWLTVLGLAFVKFSPVWTSSVTEKLKTETWRSLLVGFLTVLIAPFAFLILLVTIVGLPLAFVLGALALVSFMLSAVFVAYLVGDWVLRNLHRWENSNALRIVFGALLVTLVISLPFIGFLAKLAIVFFGTGAFLLERRDLFRRLRAQGLA